MTGSRSNSSALFANSQSFVDEIGFANDAYQYIKYHNNLFLTIVKTF